MGHFRTLLNVSAVALFAVGCSSEVPPATTPTETETTQTVFDPMLDTLDKAKGVEDIAAQRKAEMDERLKKETGGNTPN